MFIELYYVPINETATISLDELLKQLTAAGLCCRIEPEAERMFWVVLNEHESCILASVDGGQFVFGTFEISPKDDLSVIDTVNEVLFRAGYSAGEDPPN